MAIRPGAPVQNSAACPHSWHLTNTAGEGQGRLVLSNTTALLCMMAPHADKHQGGGVESIAGGRKRKAAERSGSRDSAGQKASNSKGDGVEPFREKKQQPKHRYRGMVVMAGQVEGRVGAPAATKGKEKSEGKGGTKGKGKGKSAIDDIFADVKRLKEAKAEENAERYVCGVGSVL